MARRTMLGFMAGGVSALLGGCGLFGGNRYRFRMTVEVQTPQGLRSGSSVYEVTARKLLARTSEEAERTANVRGEALMVDLPQGPLFVTLMTPEAPWPLKFDDLAQLSMAVLDRHYHNDWVESAGRIAGSWSTLRAEVPRSDWPVMVRFGDIHDPKTVERVDPEAIGVKRITIETTNDRVTTGIVNQLDWLRSFDGSLTSRLSSPDPTNPPFSARITTMDFSTEIGRAK